MARERVQRRLAAILAADVAGYSRLMGADEEGTLARLKVCRSELIDPRIDDYQGRIVKTTGDGILAEFGSVVDAVRCASEIQKEMRRRNGGTPANKRIQFRIGIHVGDVITDGDDIYGDGVNIAARLEGISEPGGICVSSAVRDEVVGKVDVEFTDSGEPSLKNIARPLRVYRIDPSETLPVPAPSGSARGRRLSVIRAVAIAAGAVAAAVAALLVFGVPANFVVAALQSRIEAESGYRLRVDGAASIALLPSPTISLRRVVLIGGHERAVPAQFAADSVRFALSVGDLLKGHARITEMTIGKPVLRLPVSRQRTASAAPAAVSEPAQAPAIDRIVIEDGTVEFYSGPDHIESSIGHVNLDATLSAADGKPRVIGSLEAGGRTIEVDLKCRKQPQFLPAETIPVEVTVRIPGLSQQPVTARAELKARNAALTIDALAGQFGQSAFSGWATIDFSATKPLVTGDVDFDHVQIDLAAKANDAPRRNLLNEPWSDKRFSLDALNFVDARFRISAAKFALDAFEFAPIVVEADLAGGVLETKLEQAELYGGQVNGTMTLDASGPTATHKIRAVLDGVQALPLLSDVAGFEHLEGTMRADIDVNGKGDSERDIISTLSGTVDFQLSNGAVRGIDVVKLMQDLTTNILSGWQQNAADKTELSGFSAQIRLSGGVANVDNLDLAGPLVRVTGAGNIDLPAKAMQMKVEPRLTAGAAGLGVPVIIQGSWSAPRLYPDIAGILDNPEAAYAQLKAAGKSLFGETPDNSGADKGPLNSLLEGLGKIITPFAGKPQAPPGAEQ